MKLIIDYNNICFTLMNLIDPTKDYFIALKTAIYEKIRSLNQRFKPDEIIIAMDSGNSYRKEICSYYKSSRGNKRIIRFDATTWTDFYELINLIQTEIKRYFPYKIIKVNKCEADDVIAIIAQTSKERVVICSKDKDFRQLLNDRIKLFDPLKFKFIEEENPERYMIEQIIKGDSIDDVYNILSRVGMINRTLTKQKSITQKFLNHVIDDLGIENYLETADKEIQNSFNINKRLVCLKLDVVPKQYQDQILKVYNEYKFNNNPDTLKEFFKGTAFQYTDFLLKYTPKAGDYDFKNIKLGTTDMF